MRPSVMRLPALTVLAASAVGLLFGAADQYLGSLIALEPWSSTVSGASAPWLVLPFAVGATQTDQRRAMLIGTTSVLAALVGYFALTISPVESVPLSHFPGDAIALLHTQLATIVGGAFTAPIFGILGQRWRTSRSWTSAALVSSSLCLEPVARFAVGRLSPPNTVWVIELLIGLFAAMLFARAGLIHRRRVQVTPGPAR